MMGDLQFILSKMQSEEVSKRRTPAGNWPCVEACITALSGGLFHICNGKVTSSGRPAALEIHTQSWELPFHCGECRADGCLDTVCLIAT